jgi:hypothetical protein
MSSIFTYYKIVSKNDNIKDCYVGKTLDFKMRIYKHKSDCYNINCKHYNIKLYQYIRENGGWDNFNFIEIETNEYDKKDSALKERELIEKFNATLNIVIPSRTKKEYEKIYCKNYYEKNAEIINEKNREYYEKNVEKIKEKQKEKITCECGCEIVKNKLSRHLKTKKHQNYLFIIK